MKQKWTEYFFKIADVVATQATCDRANVGCVIVKDKRILSTGYNGSLPGAPHCDDVGHDMVDGHCIRTVHAEKNAIGWAARYGTSLKGSSMFLTHFPCLDCFQDIVIAGIAKVYYKEAYREDNVKMVERYLEEINGTHYPNEKMMYMVKIDPNGKGH